MTPNKLRYLLPIFVISSVFCPQINGQGSTSSPYSQYGVGEPVTIENGKNVGMAGTGLARISKGSLNLLNPANIASLDSLSFYFDFGFSTSSSTYKYKGEKESSTEGNFNSLSIGFRLSPKWGFAMGFMPFSSVGYNVKTENFIEGSTTKENVWYKGSGGLSKLFMYNAYKITPDLTLGLNTSLIFGTINYEEEQSAITIDEETQAQAFYPQLGLNYNTKNIFGLPFTLGVVYSPQTKLGKGTDIQVIDNSGYILDDDEISTKKRYLPEDIGVGLAADFEKLSFALDYRQQRWDKNVSGDAGIDFTNTYKIAAGVEYTPNPRNAIKYLERINYRAGFSAGNSYLKIKGQNPYIYRTTVGLGLPIKYGSMLNVGFSWEKNTAQSRNIIDQTTYRITLGLSFTENWFFKRKFE